MGVGVGEIQHSLYPSLLRTQEMCLQKLCNRVTSLIATTVVLNLQVIEASTPCTARLDVNVILSLRPAFYIMSLLFKIGSLPYRGAFSLWAGSRSPVLTTCRFCSLKKPCGMRQKLSQAYARVGELSRCYS